MSDYEEKYNQEGEGEVEYKDEDDERECERYESPPQSPDRSSSSSSNVRYHGDRSEEDGRHEDLGIAQNENRTGESLLDGKRFPISDITGILMDMKGTKTGTTAIRIIINKLVTIRICMDKRVISTNSKTTEGMNTVMEDTVAVILTLGLLLSSTSRRKTLYLFLLSLVAH